MRRACVVIALLSLAAAVGEGCSKEPSFVDDVDGGPTTSGTGGGGAGAGGGLQTCKVAGDCGGSDTECAVRTCSNGYCGKSLTAQGTAIGAQTAGDCQRIVCDGKGNMMSEPDDTDVPNDGNSCTIEACSGGVLSTMPAAPGTACGLDNLLKCGSNGVCGGCTDASQCGTPQNCYTYTCSSSQCGLTFAPDGQATTTQTPGDCKQTVCNGMGGTRVVNDDSDTLSDNNLCTQDLCSNGVPTYMTLPIPDDGNPCTIDGCEAATGPVHMPGNDGLLCGTCSFCNAGVCAWMCAACQTCDTNSNACIDACNGCGSCDPLTGGCCFGNPCQTCDEVNHVCVTTC